MVRYGNASPINTAVQRFAFHLFCGLLAGHLGHGGEDSGARACLDHSLGEFDHPQALCEGIEGFFSLDVEIE